MKAVLFRKGRGLVCEDIPRPSPDPDQVLVQVADTGSGIRPEDLPRLFEPFFTTKAEGQGTGLGLYVCYGIIQRHDGRIHARNRPGGGTVFTVRLPVGEGP